MIELFHWEPVSHSAQVLICLNEIGIDFRSNYVDLLDFEQFTDNYLALNPFGQVPLLRDRSLSITESSLINEYLVESNPAAGLAPSGPLGWYQTQAWLKFVDYNLSSSVGTLGCRRYLVPHLRQFDHGKLTEKIESIPVAERRAGWQLAAADAYTDDMIRNCERKVRLVIERMEAVLADAEWLVSGRYSIADINTFTMVSALRDLTPDIVNAVDSPNTIGWLDRICQRPAVVRALTKNVKHEMGKIYAPGPEHSRWG